LEVLKKYKDSQKILVQAYDFLGKRGVK
jgi:hypothetical protein